MYYDRILASRDKESVANEIQTTEPKPEYEQIIKDPYVLEFLDLPPNEHFYESDVEQALIDHLQRFLLELGRGFSFVARQKHFNIDGRHFYIDLVFYNYITKCFVLFDLKTGDLTHQDIGQRKNSGVNLTWVIMRRNSSPQLQIILALRYFIVIECTKQRNTTGTSENTSDSTNEGSNRGGRDVRSRDAR